MKYTEDHEWLRVDGDVVVVGITEHASTQLGDVVFVELPEVGTMVAAGDEIVVIESVKAASDIVAPLDGEIVAVNDTLADEPGKVNEDPLGAAWFFKMKVDDLSALDGRRRLCRSGKLGPARPHSLLPHSLLHLTRAAAGLCPAAPANNGAFHDLRTDRLSAL